MDTGRERIIDIPGYTLAAREWGPPDGTPVIALHGWLDNAASFSFLAPLCPEAHIIAIDSPGCGHSSHRPPGDIPSLIDEVYFILEAATQLGFKKFSLMGHSRGGIIAQMIAVGCPERVTSLILLDIFGIHSGTPAECISHFQKSVASFFGEPKVAAAIYPDVQTAAKGRMASGSILYESALKLAERGTKKVDGGYIWAIDRRELTFISPSRYTEDYFREFMSAIHMPCCIILADNGLYLKPEEIRTKARLIKNHTLHFIPGYHHVHMDNAPIVAGQVVDFLKTLSLLP